MSDFGAEPGLAGKKFGAIFAIASFIIFRRGSSLLRFAIGMTCLRMVDAFL